MADQLTGSVDAVIVTYGGGEFLAGCVDALHAQGPVIARILVIDNASPDDTADRAADLDGVEVVRNAENLGYAAAMNQAYRLTEAPFLLSVNADCTLGPRYVEACIAGLTAQPKAAGATGVLRLPEGEIDSTGITVTTAGWATDRDRKKTRPTSGEPFGVSGAASLWRRAALDSVGPDPWWSWLFVYWDDVELSWRLRRAGWGFLCVLDARGDHRRGSDSAAADAVEGWSLRNRLATLARHGGLAGVLRPGALAVSLVVAARLLVRHPRALIAARPLDAIRAGRRERAHDTNLGDIPNAQFAHHEWRAWLGAQLGRQTHA